MPKTGFFNAYVPFISTAMKLEKVGAFFTARLNGYDEHMTTEFESCSHHIVGQMENIRTVIDVERPLGTPKSAHPGKQGGYFFDTSLCLTQ